MTTRRTVTTVIIIMLSFCLLAVALIDSSLRTTATTTTTTAATAAFATITGGGCSFSSKDSRSFSKRKPTSLEARRWNHGDDDGYNIGGSYYEREQEQKRQTSRPYMEVDRPTITKTERPKSSNINPPPKIVVLGSTGRIGRRIIEQLMCMSHLDMTIVAFARNYTKANELFSDDLVLQKRRSGSRNKGPTLEIVIGDLVPPDELPGYVDEDELLYERNAKSVSKYLSSQSNYDNKYWKDNNDDDDDDDDIIPSNEALEEALKDCTTVISCVDCKRLTNVWTDLVAFPLYRIFKKDVSSWCKDSNHPYYVHYSTTRKVLGIIESEQLRREVGRLQQQSSSSPGYGGSSSTFQDVIMNTNYKKSYKQKQLEKQQKQNKRIRFIRISDVGVTKRSGHYIPLLTNLFFSLSMRYHQMSENIMKQSNLIETMSLRTSGEYIHDNEERDTSKTSIQVVTDNEQLNYPAYISRDDVASLAVASALLNRNNDDSSSSSSSGIADELKYRKDRINRLINKVNNIKNSDINAVDNGYFNDEEESGYDDDDDNNEEEEDNVNEPPLHYTFGVRWVGGLQDSYDIKYAEQGMKDDGFVDANQCLGHVHKLQQKKLKRRRLNELNLKRKKNKISGSSLFMKKEQKHQHQQQQQQEETTVATRDSIKVRATSTKERYHYLLERHTKQRERQEKFSTTNIKPYGVYVALVSYMLLGIALKSLISRVGPYVPGYTSLCDQFALVRNMVITFVSNKIPMPTKIQSILLQQLPASNELLTATTITSATTTPPTTMTRGASTTTATATATIKNTTKRRLLSKLFSPPKRIPKQYISF